MKKVVIISFAVLLAVLVSVVVLDIIDYSKGDANGINIASFFGEILTSQATKEIKSIEDNTVSEPKIKVEPIIETDPVPKAEEEEVPVNEEVTEEIKEAEKDIIVLVKETGFDPKDIEVEVGQTVTWINKRDKMKAFIIGTMEISNMKSDMFEPTESFSWTFFEPGYYTYLDGIYVTQSGTVRVK